MRALSFAVGMTLCLGAASADVAANPVPSSPAQPGISLMGPGLLVRDIEVAVHFYRDGLGLKEAGRFGSSEMSEVAFAFGPDGKPPFLILMQPRVSKRVKRGDAPRDANKIVLVTSNADMLAARLKSAGFAPDGITENAKLGVKTFWVVDTDGHSFEIIERRSPKP